jgi:hypothetical protein
MAPAVAVEREVERFLGHFRTPDAPRTDIHQLGGVRDGHTCVWFLGCVILLRFN